MEVRQAPLAAAQPVQEDGAELPSPLTTAGAGWDLGNASSEKILYHAYASGNRSAFAELARKIEPDIACLIGRWVRDKGLVEDLVQDTLMTLATRIETFDPSRELMPWVYQIARHRTLDALRHQRRHPHPDLDLFALRNSTLFSDQGQGDPSRLCERRDWEDHVLKVLADLRATETAKGSQRARELEVFCAIHDEGLSYQQAAARFELPVGTVKSTVNRVKTRLSKALERERER